MMLTSRIAWSVLLTVAIGLIMTSWSDGSLAQQRPSELRLDMKAVEGEDKPEKPAAPKPAGKVAPPKLSSCGKPITLTKNATACNPVACSEAEAELRCSVAQEQAAQLTFAKLVNVALDEVFGFEPANRTDAQRKSIASLRELVGEAERTDAMRTANVDKLATMRPALKKLADEAIAKGSAGPIETGAMATLMEAYETGRSQADVAGGVADMSTVSARYARTLAQLDAAVKAYQTAAGQLRSRLEAPAVTTAMDTWNRSKATILTATAKVTKDCKPCETAQSSPAGNKPITITEATFGAGSIKCDGKDFVDLKCSRTPVTYALCRTSATDATVKLCGTNPPSPPELTVSPGLTTEAAPPANLRLDTCHVLVTAKGICGTATQAMMSAAQVNKGEIKYKCAGNNTERTTGPQFEGKTVILDCRPQGG